MEKEILSMQQKIIAEIRRQIQFVPKGTDPNTLSLDEIGYLESASNIYELYENLYKCESLEDYQNLLYQIQAQDL